jgi:hypothetical protein
MVGCLSGQKDEWIDGQREISRRDNQIDRWMDG